MSKKLLVVDDAVIIREIIKDTLKSAGWTIVGEADNGQTAIERYRELQPDVMTLDMVMPGFDGLHALRQILQEFPAAKIIVVSALDQKNVLKDAFKIGAADFILKPFDKKNLVETVERVIATSAVETATPVV